MYVHFKDQNSVRKALDTHVYSIKNEHGISLNLHKNIRSVQQADISIMHTVTVYPLL